MSVTLPVGDDPEVRISAVTYYTHMHTRAYTHMHTRAYTLSNGANVLIDMAI